MNYPGYEVSVSDDQLHFEFVSEGIKGNIHKVVEYTYLSQLAMWNLGFGDFNVATGQVRDSVISNNGDARKVMATVIGTLLSFFGIHAGATVIFTGSDERRTVIYQRIIRQYYTDFSDLLIINGLTVEGIEQAIETTVKYIAFVIRKR